MEWISACDTCSSPYMPPHHWTCLPDTNPGDRAPMCNDATWMKLMGMMMGGAGYVPDRVKPW